VGISAFSLLSLSLFFSSISLLCHHQHHPLSSLTS
jgi:hypothetical protein